jgi:hypothetical protein
MLCLRQQIANDPPRTTWSRSSASVRKFQRYEPGNRDREVELPDNRLQICQAAGRMGRARRCPRSPWSSTW